MPPEANTATDRRFDLHFQGKVLSGHHREDTIRAFARLFGVRGLARAEQFFSGAPVILRRRLTRDQAANLYVRLRRIGMLVELRPSEPEQTKTAAAAPVVDLRQLPNLYALVSPVDDPRRVARARQIAGAALAFALGMAATLLLLLAVYWRLPDQPPLPTLSAVGIGSGGELWVATDTRLIPHTRAGVPGDARLLADLGIAGRVTALAPVDGDSLWLLAETAQDSRTLFHCELASSCSAHGSGPLRGLLWLPRTRQLVLARDGRLDLLDEQASPLAAGAVSVADAPRMLAHEGLLLINSSQGPAISVLRPEIAYFGTQLDELLLLPEEALQDELDRTGPFARAGEGWWALLHNAGGEQSRIYRFDDHWRPLQPVTLPGDSQVDDLLAWGRHVLVADFSSDVLLRFSAEGEPLAPLPVSALQAERQTGLDRAARQRLLWRFCLASLALLCVAALLIGIWQRLRAGIFARLCPTDDSPLRDPERMLWLAPDTRRLTRLLQLTTLLGVLAIAGIALVIALQGSTATLAGVLLMLAGPSLGLWLLARAPLGMLALHGSQLVLVDHRGCYRQAPARQACWNSGFIALGDLLICTGSPLLPMLDTDATHRELGLLLSQSPRLPPATAAVLLLDARHPLGIAGLLTLVGLCAGLLLIASG